MNLKEINKWWTKGMAKEQLRHTDSDKPYKGDRFSVRLDSDSFVKPYKKGKPNKAR